MRLIGLIESTCSVPLQVILKHRSFAQVSAVTHFQVREQACVLESSRSLACTNAMICFDLECIVLSMFYHLLELFPFLISEYDVSALSVCFDTG